MKKFRRNFTAVLIIMAVAGLNPVSVLAQTTTQVSADSALIADLLKQIQSLQEQIRQIVSARSQSATATSTLELKQELRRGMSGEEVKMLQRILATDKTLYPEGLVTGFFGPLTEQAVGRLQSKFKLQVKGAVGQETLDLVNAFLKAQGVMDATIPADLITSAATKIKIEVKNKNGELEYKIEVKCDSSGSGNQCNEDEDEDEDDEDEDDDEEDENDSDKDEDDEDDEDED